MTRPSHAALIEEVAKVIDRFRSPHAAAYEVLSLIAARLSDVTPEMVEAYERNYDNSIGEAENVCVSDWRAMLAASCLGETKP
jgi:hypothetical protein